MMTDLERRLTVALAVHHQPHADRHGQTHCNTCDLLLEVWDEMEPSMRRAVFQCDPHLPRPTQIATTHDTAGHDTRAGEHDA